MRRSRSSRVPPRALIAACVVVLTAAGITGCSGSGKKAAKTVPPPITSSVALKLTGATVESAGPSVGFPTDVRNAVAKVVNAYVESGVVTALRTGTAAPTLATVFTPDAAAKLAGPDRAVVTDDGVPKATGSIGSNTATYALTALADTGGHLVLVSAALSLDLHSVVSGGQLRVVRNGDVLLAPVAGGWRIAGYDLSVLRAGPGVAAAKAPRHAHYASDRAGADA